MKRLVSYFIFLSLLIPAYESYAQDTKKFFSAFPPLKLPFCISYPDSDFLTETGTTQDGEDTCISYKGVLTIDYANALSFKDVRAFLYNDSEKNEHSSTDSGWMSYYSVGSISVAGKFLILVYGETSSSDSGYCSEESQYLCTVTKKAKLISKLLIGSAGFSGEGLCGHDSDVEGGVIFYSASCQGCIEPDLKIKLDYGRYGLYIDNDGYIKQEAISK